MQSSLIEKYRRSLTDKFDNFLYFIRTQSYISSKSKIPPAAHFIASVLLPNCIEIMTWPIDLIVILSSDPRVGRSPQLCPICL